MMAADIIPKVEVDDHQTEQSKITKEELSSMSNQALLEKMRDEMLKRISNNLISNKSETSHQTLAEKADKPPDTDTSGPTLTDDEKQQITKILEQQNPDALAAQVAKIFRQKFQKELEEKTSTEAFQDENSNQRDIPQSFPQIEEYILQLFDAAELQGKSLTGPCIRSQAMAMAKQLEVDNFVASPGWMSRFLQRHNRKLAKCPRRVSQDKRKPFVRLSFGEKYEISQFILKNSKWPVRAYAEHFTKLWNRNITQKQIEVTKDNISKWSQECYKNSTQSYEKFQRKSSIRLSRSEREEIGEFISLNGSLTLEETARIFTERWNKDVNRTHIARIKNCVKLMGNVMDDDMDTTSPMPYRDVHHVTNSTHVPPVPQISHMAPVQPLQSIASYQKVPGKIPGFPDYHHHSQRPLMTHHPNLHHVTPSPVQRHHETENHHRNQLLQNIMMSNFNALHNMSSGLSSNGFKGLGHNPLPTYPGQMVHHPRHNYTKIHDGITVGSTVGSQTGSHGDSLIRETDSPRSTSNHDSVISRSPVSDSTHVHAFPVGGYNFNESPHVPDRTQDRTENQVEQTRVPVITSVIQPNHSVIMSNPAVKPENQTYQSVIHSRSEINTGRSESTGHTSDLSRRIKVENQDNIHTEREGVITSLADIEDTRSQTSVISSVSSSDRDHVTPQQCPEGPFRCPQCPAQFGNGDLFWQHLRRDHYEKITDNR